MTRYTDLCTICNCLIAFAIMEDNTLSNIHLVYGCVAANGDSHGWPDYMR